MTVKIQARHEYAVLPKKAHAKDFCYDVTAVSEEEIAPNVWKYKLGFAAQIEREPIRVSTTNGEVRFIEPDMLDLSIDLRPRSGVWKTGMILSNCEGTIDEIFTGEISAVFYHVLPNMPRYKVGDRIGQIKIGLSLPMEFVEVEELDATDRGEGSYGSSGR